MKSFISIFFIGLIGSCTPLTNVFSPINYEKIGDKTFVMNNDFQDHNDSLLIDFKENVNNNNPSKYKLIYYTDEKEPVIAIVKYKPEKIKIRIDKRRVENTQCFGKTKRYIVLVSNVINAQNPMDILVVYD